MMPPRWLSVSALIPRCKGLRQATVNSGQANSDAADRRWRHEHDLRHPDPDEGPFHSILLGPISRRRKESSWTPRFQALISEIDRVADDTDFAGTQLLDGSITITAATGFTPSAGVSAITAQGLAEPLTTGASEYTISFASAATGGTFTINTSTDTTNVDGTYTGTIDSEAVDGGTQGALARATTVKLDGAGTSAGSFTIALNTAFAATAVGAISNTFTGSSTLDLNFKLGTGTATEDSLTFTLDAINTSALGLASQDITTESTANSALEAINNAIDTLNEFRADVGAAQNRLEFASNNLNVSIENAEAARSHAAGFGYCCGDDQILKQAGPHAVRRCDAGSSQPDAAESAQTAAIIDQAGEREPSPRIPRDDQ